MAVARNIERLQRDLSAAAKVIDQLVRENFELREQVDDLVNRTRREQEPRQSANY